MKKAIAIILFKIGWLSCVFGRQEGLETYLPIVVLLILFVNFKFVLDFPFRSLPLYFILVALGIGMDLGMLELGAYKAIPEGPIFPGWLFYLWLFFPLNFFHYFTFLDGRKWIAMIIGAIGGPLSYSLGPNVGLLEFNNYSLGIISVAWALYFLIAVTLKKFLYPSENKLKEFQGTKSVE